MYDRLVDTDAWTGSVYPRLARTIEIGPDQLTYTIKLRQGLIWSDGKPITADDVVFTFNTIVKEAFGNASFRDTLSVYGRFPTVSKVDDLTTRFRTHVPFKPFLNSLATVPVAPKHVLAAVVTQGKNAFYNFWNVNCDPASLVVSGRFKLKRYLPGQRVELEKNPHYRMVDREGHKLPYLDKVVLAVVPDQNTQVLRFYGEEIDFLDIRSVRGSDAALMKQRERSGNFSMYNLGPDDGTMFLVFNMNRRRNPETGKYYVDPVKQKWFNKRFFRQAVSHAIDRQRMVDNVLRGVGVPLFTPESPASLYFNQNLKTYGQDLGLAARLLERGGFAIKDGKLYDADGNRVEFTLNTNAGNSSRDGACIMIVEELKKLGIKVNYQPVEFNILVDKLDHSLDWEAMVMGLTGGKLEPYDGANVWKSNGRLHMFDQRLPDATGTITVTDARFWEQRIDELFDKAATTFDEDARQKYFSEYQEVVYSKVPFIYLYCPLDISAMRKSIGNYKPTLLGIYYPPLGTLHNLEEIYLKRGSAS